jgi:hypothetical protein
MEDVRQVLLFPLKSTARFELLQIQQLYQVQFLEMAIDSPDQ